MIHLDTSFLIRALDPGSAADRKLRDWIERDEPLGMSAIAWAELLCGPLGSAEMELAAEIVGQHRDFTPSQAVMAARLFNESGRRRGSLVDCMIAAAALSDGASLATANVSDFRRFATSGLELA